jgi:hypothetical protein
MVLLSCSGTGAGIYAKLANGTPRYNGARAAIHRCCDLLCVVNKRSIAKSLIDRVLGG